MTLDEYRQLDGIALAELIATGAVSAEAIANLAMAAIEFDNGGINAVIGTTPSETQRALAANCKSPLAGVPFLIKDIGLSFAGIPCEFGSRLARGFVPDHDTALARRLKDAGLVTLGRTNTPEFGCNGTTEPVHGGTTRNPWNTDHSAGGSSGGAAAAVAAGMVPVAHANDGGGSIRIPAHCCGVFGLKPSRGVISAAPDADESFFGMGSQLVVSRTVRDSAAVFDIMRGREPGDRFVLPPTTMSALHATLSAPRPLNILFWTTMADGSAPADDEYMTALSAFADRLRSLGHKVQEASLPVDHRIAGDLFLNLAGIGATHAIDGLAGAMQRPIDESTLEIGTLRFYEHGKRQSATDIMSALDALNTVIRGIGTVFEEADVVLSPVGVADAPLLGELDQNRAWGTAEEWKNHIFSRYPIPALCNVTGQPAMSVPMGLSARGLPLGAHFIADMGQENLLFQLAAQIERESPWPSLV
ncbi:MAG: amidase [Haliea sp.]